MLIFTVNGGTCSGTRTDRPVSAMASTFVNARQPTFGDYRCGEGGEEGTRPCSIQFRAVNGAARLARESEDLEGVAVRSMAFDRLGAVVSPTYGGSQDPYPGGGLVHRQRA
jgi:hypothetical protein